MIWEVKTSRSKTQGLAGNTRRNIRENQTTFRAGVSGTIFTHSGKGGR